MYFFQLKMAQWRWQLDRFPFGIHCISQNHKSWKRPWMSSSPTVNLPPPCPLNYATQCHIYMLPEQLQRWGLILGSLFQPLLLRRNNLCSRYFTSFVPFFACAWGPQHLSHGEGRKTNTVASLPRTKRLSLPWSCYVISGTSQDVIGLLGHLDVLLTHVLLAVN